MANITAFPTPHDKPVKFGNYGLDGTFICAVDVAAGQCVGLNTDGKLIIPTAGGIAIGAALNAQIAGEEVAVRMDGIVSMANGDDTAAIAPGTFVAVGPLGGVKAVAAGQAVVGITTRAIPGGGFGYVKLAQAQGVGGA